MTADELVNEDSTNTSHRDAHAVSYTHHTQRKLTMDLRHLCKIMHEHHHRPHPPTRQPYFLSDGVECIDVDHTSQQPLIQHQEEGEPEGWQEEIHSSTEEEHKVHQLENCMFRQQD